MNLFSLLTQKNIKIFSAIAEEELSLREIADKVKCSPGKAHQAIKLFKENNLVETQKKKNRLLIKPNRKNPLYQKIKALININQIISSKAYSRLKQTGILGVYGSYANGTDDKNSDIDLIIVTEKKELPLRPIIRELEEDLKRRVNPLIIPRNKLLNLEKEFLVRLKLTTISLNGDIFG